MIRKRTSFHHPSMCSPSSPSPVNALLIENGLLSLATEISLNQHKMWWTDIQRIFDRAEIVGHKLTDQEFTVFQDASKNAYRMETSVMLESRELVLRIKFYLKNMRNEFLSWRIAFSNGGAIITKSEMIGYDKIGQAVMS